MTYEAVNYMTEERRTFPTIEAACEFMGGNKTLCAQVLAAEEVEWFERGDWLCARVGLIG